MRENYTELTAAVTALANLIAKRLDDDEIGLLAAALVQLGDTLATIAASRAICKKEEAPIISESF